MHGKKKKLREYLIIDLDILLSYDNNMHVYNILFKTIFSVKIFIEKRF